MIRFCKRCQVETERHTSGECKVCARARQVAYRANHPEKRLASDAAWRATNSDKLKTYSAAWRAANPANVKRSKDTYYAANADQWKAYYAANIEKIRAYKSALYAADPETTKARVKAWVDANPEAIRIYSQNRHARKTQNGGQLSQGLAQKLLKLQRGLCACCKKPLGKDYQLDHIIPIARGGPNVDGNIQLLRRKCNSQKRARHPVDFMQSRGFLL